MEGDEALGWARANGVHPKTAYHWYRNGTLPVPARQINARVILVDVEHQAVTASACLRACRPTTSALTWTGKWHA
jgi:predicted site-specific integrase-resolvase